jgi:hypothetical protein
MLEMPQPQRTSVRALAYLTGAMLGDPLPRSSPAWFDAHHPEACRALGVRPLVGAYPGDAAPAPCVAAYLAAALDAQLEVTSDGAVIVIPQPRRSDPLARRLAAAGGVIALA